MLHQVFISYAKADYRDEQGQIIENNIITELKQALTDAKIDYWIDEEGISSGGEFASIIAHAIINCDALIYVSSAASNSSKWTARELALANEHDKPIIPLKCDDAPYSLKFAMYLATVQYIDCRYNRKKALKTLTKTIRDIFDGVYDPDKPYETEEKNTSQILSRHSVLSGLSTLLVTFFFFYFGLMVLFDDDMPTPVHSAMEFITAVAYLAVAFLMFLSGYGAWQLFQANRIGYWFLLGSFPGVLVAAQNMSEYIYWVLSYVFAIIFLFSGLFTKVDGHAFAEDIRSYPFHLKRYWGLAILFVFFCVYAVYVLRF